MSSLGIMQETLDVKMEDDKNETSWRLEGRTYFNGCVNEVLIGGLQVFSSLKEAAMWALL